VQEGKIAKLGKNVLPLEKIMSFTTNPLATRCNWLLHAT
jgi:hypothetical protein